MPVFLCITGIFMTSTLYYSPVTGAVLLTTFITGLCCKSFWMVAVFELTRFFVNHKNVFTVESTSVKAYQQWSNSLLTNQQITLAKILKKLKKSHQKINIIVINHKINKM
jgi:hypothetical protein